MNSHVLCRCLLTFLVTGHCFQPGEISTAFDGSLQREGVRIMRASGEEQERKDKLRYVSAASGATLGDDASQETGESPQAFPGEWQFQERPCGILKNCNFNMSTLDPWRCNGTCALINPQQALVDYRVTPPPHGGYVVLTSQNNVYKPTSVLSQDFKVYPLMRFITFFSAMSSGVVSGRLCILAAPSVSGLADEINVGPTLINYTYTFKVADPDYAHVQITDSTSNLLTNSTIPFTATMYLWNCGAATNVLIDHVVLIQTVALDNVTRLSDAYELNHTTSVMPNETLFLESQ